MTQHRAVYTAWMLENFKEKKNLPVFDWEAIGVWPVWKIFID